MASNMKETDFGGMPDKFGRKLIIKLDIWATFKI